MKALQIKQAPAGLVLTPGAGADRDHITLVALDKGIKEVSIHRLTLGTTSIKSAVKKIHEAGQKLATKLDVDPRQIAYGGRSFGGRAASVAVAEGLPASALVLMSYPLHPPGKPENLRIDHFDQIKVPVLFISGDKDPFGSAREFEEHMQTISAPHEMQWIKGNHSPKGRDQDILHMVRHFLKIK